MRFQTPEKITGCTYVYRIGVTTYNVNPGVSKLACDTKGRYCIIAMEHFAVRLLRNNEKDFTYHHSKGTN